MRRIVRTSTALAALLFTAPAWADDYPVIPEPMVFDMMRPLGARRGELEVNTLAQTALSGEKTVDWAPELEYTYADGLAVEFELPFSGSRLTELKLGLQAAFGSFNNGRSAHGIQYLGIYDRHQRRYSSTVAYMLGHRFNDRWSSISMLGLSKINLSKQQGHNALIVNHALFFDAATQSVLGLEVNWEGGGEGGVLVIPQLHQELSRSFKFQAGAGLQKDRGDVVRPRLGLRLIREM